MEKELTKWDFKDELRAMAASCIGVKEATAKKKASALFKKYDEIIAWSKTDNDYYRDQYRRIRNMFDALKSGSVNYVSGKREGVLLIKDIEQVEVREKDVLLTTKTGREIELSNDFEYLKDIF
ncbi:MAG: hypothetical protein GX163_12050 [Bacteroidetes bacterium]|nr:hypothetical protein [Bacteroidota bacterium]